MHDLILMAEILGTLKEVVSNNISDKILVTGHFKIKKKVFDDLEIHVINSFNVEP